MNPRDKIRAAAKSRVRVRMTSQRRSATGFDVKINGEAVHHSQSFKEAFNALYARLVCLPRTVLEITPGKGGTR